MRRGGDAAIKEPQQTGVTSPPVLASAVASVITGTALVATRFVVPGSDGLTIATLRYVVAAVCLLPLVPIFDQNDRKRVAICFQSPDWACFILAFFRGASARR